MKLISNLIQNTVSDKTTADLIAREIRSGYWHLNGKYFFNKGECLRYATSTGIMGVTYHYFDDIYDALDWNKEPEETLDELYKQRALQLREKYDYLTLAFSGGADSMNILDTFLDNDIKLDEILSYFPVQVIEQLKSAFDPLDHSPSNHMFEYFGVLKRLEEVRKSHPDIKITIMDVTNDIPKLISSGKIQEFTVVLAGASPPTTNYLPVLEHAKTLSDKNYAIIQGLDKPRMIHDAKANKLGVFFSDIYNVWAKVPYNGFAPNVELFYYTPDLPNILRKQAHVIKKAMVASIPIEDRNRPDRFSKWTKTWYPWKLGDQINTDWPKVEALIYSKYSPDIFQTTTHGRGFIGVAQPWIKLVLPENITFDYRKRQIEEAYLHGISHDRFVSVSEQGVPTFKPITSRVILLNE